MGLLGFAAACGDDSGDKPKDAAVDAAADGGDNHIPRFDGAVAGESAVPFCDRFDPSSCEAGEVCDEVIEVVPSNGTTQIYTGCVKVTGLRGAGDPCTAWNDRYSEISEEVYYDPCGDGLICADDPDVRGSTSCQPVCVTGRFGDPPVGCESDSAFCVSIGAYREVCLESDACDVSAQTGCRSGEACYLRLDDLGEGLLSVCLTKPLASERVADHEACQYLNDCNPGSSCIGPLHLAPIEWTADDFACRPVCSGSSNADAGPGDDAGIDDCAGEATCVTLAGSGLGSDQLPKRFYGLCELSNAPPPLLA